MTADAVQTLLDRIEIEKLAIIYMRGNDIDASHFDLCMTDDVEVITPFAEWKGIEAQKRHRDSNIGTNFNFTQCFLTNSVIEIDGDTAQAEYQVFAFHSLKEGDGKDVVFSGGIYIHDVVRLPIGWRIKRHTYRPLWRSKASAA